MRNLTFIFFIAVLAFGCQAPPAGSEQESSAAVTDFSFEQKEVLRQEGNCDSEPGPCVQVEIGFPLANGGAEAARRAVNTFFADQIATSLSGAFEEERTTGNLDTLADAFVRAYKQFIQDFPNSAQQWSFESRGEVVYQSPEAISLMIETYMYTGGAHPMSMVHYASFDPKSGERLRLEDLVADMAAFTQRAEATFRQEKGIDPGISLSEAGFTFENDTFALTGNFALLEQGIVFFYNPYEIGPYALGPTELLVPQKEKD